MNPEKTRPLTTKPSKATSAKAGRRVWGILIFILLLIAAAYFIWPKPEPESVLPVSQSPSMAEQTEAAQATAIDDATIVDELDTVLSDSTVADESIDIVDDKNIDTPNPKAILNAPLPKTESLAKEEIDLLEDKRKRFAEQEKLAAEQLAMNQQLTDMKAEQIALLEQQIAQLEADSAADTASK